MARPTTFPEWGTSGSDIVEPSSGVKQIGWVNGVPVPAGYINWWMNADYNWHLYFDDQITSIFNGFKDNIEDRYTYTDPGSPEYPAIPASSETFDSFGSFTSDSGGVGATNEVLKSGSTYVLACESGNRIYTSSDLDTWTGRTAGSSAMRGLAADGAGNMVAVGGSTSSWKSTDDGDTWTETTSVFATIMYDVSYNGTNWIAVGPVGSIYYSANGTSWTLATLPTGSLTSNSVSCNLSTGRIVIASDPTSAENLAIIYSDDDGVNYTQALNSATTFTDSVYSPTLDMWFAVGGSDIYSSASGTGSWSSVHTMPTAPNILGRGAFAASAYDLVVFARADFGYTYTTDGSVFTDDVTDVGTSDFLCCYIDDSDNKLFLATTAATNRRSDIATNPATSGHPAISAVASSDSIVYPANPAQLKLQDDINKAKLLPIVNFPRNITGITDFNQTLDSGASDRAGADEIIVVPGGVAGHVKVIQNYGSTVTDVTSGGDVKRMIHDGTNFIYPGDAGIRYSSTPLTPTWSMGYTAGGSEDFNDIATDGTYNVSVGDTTTNGIIYVTTPASPTGWNLEHTASGDPLNACAAGGGWYVAVGDNGTILSIQTDPTGTWVQRSTGTAVDFGSVAGSPDGVFLAGAANSTRLYRSDNGVGWTDIAANIPNFGTSTLSPEIHWSESDQVFIVLDKDTSSRRMWVSDRYGSIWTEIPLNYLGSSVKLTFGDTYNLLAVEATSDNLKATLLK